VDFLKPIHQWDEDYVVSLPGDEFDWLEYKQSEKFADPNWSHDMSKYVSAWANYDGGYMVYGVKNPQSGAPPILDAGVRETIKAKLGDWLDTVIPALVEPPLQKLSTALIHPKSQHSPIQAGNVLIAVHIPGSEIAPHQALDHKYYQRLGRHRRP
jgi:predicted HTH transcriptional regulator